MKRIAILAGGGTLPLVLADSIVDRGGQAHIVAVRGEAGPAVEAYPHTWVTWGAVNAIIATIKAQSDATMMIAGSVSRPDLLRLKPDFGVIRYLPQILTMLRGGDDAVLTRLVRFFEAQGLAVLGVADVAPQLLAEAGTFGSLARASAELDTDTDTALGFQVLDLLADLDVGQAIAIEGGRVLAIEGVEGTDRMLARIAGLQERGTASGGVLVKGPKRGQDLRVDMPAVGARTIDGLAAARLSKLVIAADKTLVLERAELVRRAETERISVEAVLRDAAPSLEHPRDRRVATPWIGANAGWITPSVADRHDAETAASVIVRLAPFGTGHAAVVIRDHVLAIAACETADAMARRVAALRQWGRGRFRRKAGAAAIACSGAGGTEALTECIEVLASAGLAGVALVTRGMREQRAVSNAIPAAAILAADRLKVFLIVLNNDTAPAAAEAA